METVLQKQWDYILSKDDDGRHLLAVICGTVGLFEIAIALNPEETRQYQIEGEVYIGELARQIRNDPEAWMMRKIN